MHLWMRQRMVHVRPNCASVSRCPTTLICGVLARDHPAGTSQASLERAMFTPPACQGKREPAPRADFADHREIAPHALCHLPTDRQPQAGAVLVSRQPRINLHEGLENALEIIRCDATSGVGDRHVDPFPALFLAGDGDHAARIGELDRVGEQVENDLLHLFPVCTHGEAAGAAAPPQLELLLPRVVPHKGAAPGEQLIQRHILDGEVENPRLELRVGQHIVDDAEQLLLAGL